MSLCSALSLVCIFAFYFDDHRTGLSTFLTGEPGRRWALHYEFMTGGCLCVFQNQPSQDQRPIGRFAIASVAQTKFALPHLRAKAARRR
jgi:hypothetical protein